MEKGHVDFKPVGDQRNIPERYRLEAHAFPYELRLKRDLTAQGFTVYELCFPSPVATKYPENNTVYAEYYRPAGDGPFPGVVVLDILGGDQTLSRTQSALLAQARIAALFVQMPYYGLRRPAGSRVRLLMPDVNHSLDAVRQTVLDVRRAGAWLASRPEIDADRLGIMGTSLGSFMGALSAAMEPRFRRVAILLGGGGLVDAFYDHPQAQSIRTLWELVGGTRERLQALVGPADPLTYADNLKDRRLLFMGAKRDEIVPPKATEALWKATGRQKILWYDCTHTGAVLYFLPAMEHIIDHFQAP